MEIIDVVAPGGRVVEAYGSRGFTAEAISRSEGAAVTILRVKAAGLIGSHPTEVDQILLVVKGRGAVQSGDGPWEPVGAGQAALWRAGEVHATRADEDLTAFVVEAPELFPPADHS